MLRHKQTDIFATLAKAKQVAKEVEAGKPIGDFRKVWTAACTEAKMSGILFHDLRRSAVRNMDCSGVGQAVAMKITGHKTLSAYQRYRIVAESDIREALDRTEVASSQNKQRRFVAIAEVKEFSR